MIVLDATNKSLTAKTPVGSTATIRGSVVTYWSIVSNVWIPKSFETPAFGLASSTTLILLPAPVAGETKVVENVWLHYVTGTGAFDIDLTVGAIEHLLASFRSEQLDGQTITLGRDGNFTRQEQAWIPTTNATQNSH